MTPPATNPAVVIPKTIGAIVVFAAAALGALATLQLPTISPPPPGVYKLDVTMHPAKCPN